MKKLFLSCLFVFIQSTSSHAVTTALYSNWINPYPNESSATKCVETEGDHAYNLKMRTLAHKALKENSVNVGCVTYPYLGTPYNFAGLPKAHAGIDLRARTPLPVYAVTSGTVVHVDKNNAGNVNKYGIVMVETTIGQEVVRVLYLHLSAITVNVHDVLTVGKQIGLTGSTGTGAAHLHIEVRRNYTGSSAVGFISCVGNCNTSEDVQRITSEPTILVTDAEVQNYINLKSFPDVQHDKWYRAYLEFLKNEGVMKGYGDGYFKPDKKISRKEFMKLVVVAMERQGSIPATAAFATCINQVPATFIHSNTADWSNQYLKKGYCLDNANNAGEKVAFWSPNKPPQDTVNYPGLDSWDVPITREEVARVLMNASSIKPASKWPIIGWLPLQSSLYTDVTDLQGVSIYAVKKHFEDMGYTLGYSAGIFQPLKEINRAETTKIICKGFFDNCPQ